MKLKQKVISLSILFTCMFMTGVSAADSQELVIKAYKIARSDQQGITEFVVTDALADFDNLDKISDTRNEIILDRHINTYLGNGSTRLDEGAFSEQIVFSVRVAGAGSSEYFETEPTWWGGTSEKLVSDKYKVTMTFSPFYYGADLSYIKASYQLGNVTGIFEETSSPDNGEESILISETSPDYVYVDGSENKDLSFTWSVDTERNSVSHWTVRAAVAMAIDEGSYNNCKQYGKHSATVTVTLEAIS